MAPTALMSRAACRSEAPPGPGCQTLEITAKLWSDRRKPCTMRAGHVEHRRPQPTVVRRSTQASRPRASGAGFASGA